MAEPSMKYQPEDLEPDISHIEIEDGEPVGNIFSEKQQQLLLDCLETSLQEELRPVVGLANVGLFASPDLPPLVPDLMATFQKKPPGPLDYKKNKTYFIWNYGRPPDIVIEIVSNREGDEGTRKLEKYAEWRVGHYIIYDPFEYLGSRKLRAYQLQGRNYVELLEPTKLIDFGLGLVVEEGEYRGYEGPWLRWTDASGKPLMTGAEKVLAEAKRAEAEKARADTEKARADELAQKLKELGYEL